MNGRPPPQHPPDLIELFDIALALADVRVSGDFDSDCSRILDATARQAYRLFAFTSVSLLLVDPVTLEFKLRIVRPSTCEDKIQEEVEEQIASGSFAWALDQHRLVGVPAVRAPGYVTMHVMATRNDVIGMFFGCTEDDSPIRDAYRGKTLSVLVANAAYMLESAGLARRLSEQNRLLERQVEERTAELNHALRLAERASSAKSDFLAVMTHEIRTPMNAIIGMTELVLDSSLSDDQRSLLATVKESSDHLLGLVNNILDFSKIEAGHMQLAGVSFALHHHIEKTFDILSTKFAEKKLEAVFFLASTVPRWVRGDPHRLRQILINLIGNAVKFTNTGGGIVLFVESRDSGDGSCELHFAVGDSGPGIPTFKLNGIFDAFTQADSSIAREYGGTGLGLTITKQIVELMGGSIWVKSRLGVGSAFHFAVTLPLAVAESISAESGPLAGQSASFDDGCTRKAKILVVDDSRVNLQLVNRILSRRGYEIENAENGDEAVMKAAVESFDLIFMDCQMPLMDGFEATALIRKVDAAKGRRTPIVALTALAISGDRERCMDSGMDDYITKPIDRKELEAIVDRLTAKRS